MCLFSAAARSGSRRCRISGYAGISHTGGTSIDGGSLVIAPPLPWALKRDTAADSKNAALATHGVLCIRLSVAVRRDSPINAIPSNTHRSPSLAPRTRPAPRRRWRCGSTISLQRRAPTLYQGGADDRSYVLRVEEGRARGPSSSAMAATARACPPARIICAPFYRNTGIGTGGVTYKLDSSRNYSLSFHWA